MVVLQQVLTFLSSWKFVLLFYIVVAIIVYINRKKFQVEGGFVLLYRTQFGIKFIERFTEKHKEFLKIVGYTAIGVGFLGMILICGLLIKGVYELLFVPTAPPTLSLVIPGVQIPGSPIFVPFWYGIIALFIVIVVHEFGHGIIARSHGLKIKNTGFGFLGPLPLAFVEPDETQVVKKESIVQQSIFAAGPFFNGLLVAVILVLSLLIINPIISTMVTSQGISFMSVQDGYPAQQYGVQKNVVYTNFNGVQVNDTDQFIAAASCIKPNDNVTLSNNNSSISLIATVSPTDKTKGYMGVTGMSTNFVLKSQQWWYKGIYYALFVLANLFEWIATLSLGIGLANLLPLGPVDGGRMLNKAAIDINGKKKGVKIWAAISIITVIVMAILIFVPIIKHIFFKV